MPYIKPEDRQQFEWVIQRAVNKLLKTKKKSNELKLSVGELNYLISSIVWRVFDANPSYTIGNNLIGVLECVKQEFYRRKLAPYEDLKIRENGDI